MQVLFKKMMIHISTLTSLTRGKKLSSKQNTYRMWTEWFRKKNVWEFVKWSSSYIRFKELEVWPSETFLVKTTGSKLYLGLGAIPPQSHSHQPGLFFLFLELFAHLSHLPHQRCFYILVLIYLAISSSSFHDFQGVEDFWLKELLQ